MEEQTITNEVDSSQNLEQSLSEGLDRLDGTEHDEVPSNQVAEGQDEQQSDGSTEEQPQENEESEELEEIEFEGKSFRVPKEVKDGLLRQSDYTRKSQDLAERAAIQQQYEAALILNREFEQGVSNELTALQEINYVLNQFKQVDWTKLDTDSFLRTKHELELFEKKRDEIFSLIQNKRQEFEQRKTEAEHSAIVRGQQYLQKAIPKWEEVSKKEVISYLNKQGYSDQVLSSVKNPVDLVIAYKAMQYDKLTSNKSVALSKAKTALPIVKPGSTKNPAQKSFKEKLKGAKDQKQVQELIKNSFSHL